MSAQLKKQQYWLLGIIVTVLAVLILALTFLGQQAPQKTEKEKPVVKKYNLASPLSNASSEAHWIEKTQNAWKAELEKDKQVDKHLQTLSDEKIKQQQLIQTQQQELVALKETVNTLKEEVSHLQTQKENSAGSATNTAMLPVAAEENINSSMALNPGFIHYTAKLNRIQKPRIKTPANYVFSNTFAKAVVLQGADAAASALSQTNPDVMIFQIIDDGIMPNKYRAHLKGCFVSASVIGDISSERGKLRTERISCIHANGTSLDTQVTGIVADSKNGIRGRAVWRDGPMARKAFWGGFWQSMGKIGEQYATEYSTSPLGSVATIQPSKIPLASVSSGGSDAAKMYAQYTIKRAEMYHPIIQLPPATIVDITFLKGFWLDGGNDEKAPEMDESSPKQAFVNPPEPSSPEEQAANQFFYEKHSF